MRLVKLSKFREMVYAEGSAPCLETLRARIHDIPGGTIQLGRYYVDLDEYDRATGLRSSIEARIKVLRADPLLEGLV